MRIEALLIMVLGFTVSTACFPPALEQDTVGAVDTATDDSGTDDSWGDAEVGPDSETSLVPSELVASVERVDDVELTWSGGAPAFWVYRCDDAPCAGEWRRLTSEPTTEREFRDTTALAPGALPAPTLRIMEDGRHIDLSWDAVVAPSAPRYSYRVTAVVDGVESAPSTEVMGHRAERPVVGYEVSVAQGEWEEVGGVTTWRDASADPPTLSLSGVVASQGTYAAHVELVASGVAATAGPTRSYRVRAVSDFGPGAAAEATGRRKAPPVALQWQRSELEAEGFEDLPLATAAVVQDTGAPADGSARYYRVVLSGVGAQPVSSEVVAGWRQPPPGVPGGLTATTELGDRVRLSWQAVSGALGYHVYRGEERLTSGSGITTTSFEDFDTGAPGEWAAPGSVTASTDRTDGIEVSWVAPARPVGPSASYSVSAVNPSGEGVRSASVSGRRSAPALDVWEVEITSAGTRTQTVASSMTQWLDEDAPRALIDAGDVTATRGAHRAFVRLTHSGGSITPAAGASYRVRGRLVGGGGTAWSSQVDGRRANGPLTRQWQRSAGAGAEGFTNLGTASAAIYEDTTASELGEKHWYRVVVSSAGAMSQISAPAQGWRLAFARLGSVSGFAISTDGQVWDFHPEIQIHTWQWSIEFSSVPGIGRLQGFEDVSSIAIGESHACAVTRQGGVVCAGSNQTGELGDGTQEARRVPVAVSSLSGVRMVTAGFSNTCAYGGTTAWCWGNQGDFEIGRCNVDGHMFLTPAAVTTANGSALSSVALLAGSATFSFHRCAVRTNGEVYCWGGEPSRCAAGLEVTLPSVPKVVSGANGTWCALLNNGEVQCWGNGAYGQLGHGQYVGYQRDLVAVTGLPPAIALSSNGYSVCAVTATGGVWCWGHNEGGRLGLPLSTTQTATPQPVPGLSGATDIAVGDFYETCAIRQGEVICWGGGNETPREIQFP